MTVSQYAHICCLLMRSTGSLVINVSLEIRVPFCKLHGISGLVVGNSNIFFFNCDTTMVQQVAKLVLSMVRGIPYSGMASRKHQ